MTVLLPPELIAAAQAVLDSHQQSGTLVACAESCTGGLVAAALTSIAGSSAVMDRGFVTYSNQAKTEMLGVPAALIEAHGAVSAEVAVAMARGALAHSRADRTVAITGVAGPGGGSPDKPVGLVHFAAGRRDGAVTATARHFSGDRDQIRLRAALTALSLLMA